MRKEGTPPAFTFEVGEEAGEVEVQTGRGPAHEAHYGLGRVELLCHQGLWTSWRWRGLARPTTHVPKLPLLRD